MGRTDGLGADGLSSDDDRSGADLGGPATPGVRGRRLLLVLVVMVLAGAVLARCWRSEMNEEQARERVEEITAALLAVADGVDRGADDIVNPVSSKAGELESDPWRYRQVNARVTLAPEAPDTAVDLANEMIAWLEADGWVRGDSGLPPSRGVRETLRANQAGGVWTAIVGGVDSEPPTLRSVYFWVVSPHVNH